MWKRFGAHLVNMFALLLWVAAVLAFLSDQAALGVRDHHRHPHQRGLRVRAGVPRREGDRGAAQPAAADGAGRARRPGAGHRGAAARARATSSTSRRATSSPPTRAWCTRRTCASTTRRSPARSTRSCGARTACAARRRRSPTSRASSSWAAPRCSAPVARVVYATGMQHRVRQDRGADAERRRAALAAAEEHRAAVAAHLAHRDRASASSSSLHRQALRRDGPRSSAVVFAIGIIVAQRARGPAADADDGAVRRRAAHGEAPRAGEEAVERRDARVDHGHLHGQDRHAHRQPDDRARGVAARAARRGRAASATRPRARSRSDGAAVTGDAKTRLDECLVGGALCNNARLKPPSGDSDVWGILGDPTEAAMLVAASKAGFDVEALHERVRPPLRAPVRLRAQAHDGRVRRRRRARRVREGRARARRSSCARTCATAEGVRPMTDADRDAALEANDRLAARGAARHRRVLARRSAPATTRPTWRRWSRG